MLEEVKRIELLFRNATDNIQFIKKQEWALVASAISAYGALIAVFRYAHLAAPWTYVAYFAIITSIFFSIYILCGLANSLEHSRVTIDWIYEKYFDTEMKVLREKKRLNLLAERRGCDKYGIFIGLFCVILLAAVIAWATIATASCLH